MKPEELIHADYKNTTAYIDKCDELIFKIRGWALLVASAVIAYSFTSEVGWVSLGNCLFVLGFLYMELVYKSLQDDAIAHSTDLEKRIGAFIKDGTALNLEGYVFGIAHHLEQPTLQKVSGVLRDPTRRHILVLYALLLFFSVVSFGVSSFVT